MVPFTIWLYIIPTSIVAIQLKLILYEDCILLHFSSLKFHLFTHSPACIWEQLIFLYIQKVIFCPPTTILRTGKTKHNGVRLDLFQRLSVPTVVSLSVVNLSSKHFYARKWKQKGHCRELVQVSTQVYCMVMHSILVALQPTVVHRHTLNIIQDYDTKISW